MPLVNKYYVCLHNQEPIEWDPFNPIQKITPECTYFGKAFIEMEKTLEPQNLIFYLTVNLEQLPSYGTNVVAVVFADEWCRIPWYFHRVGAVFKCYGTRLALGCNPILKPSYLNFLALIHYLRSWLLQLPGLLHWSIQTLKGFLFRLSVPPIFDIPLGYYKQLEIPIKEMDNRSYDISFCGSILHRNYPRGSLRYWLQTPKKLSRSMMLSTLEKLQQKYPNLKIQLSPLDYFKPGFTTTSEEEAKSYSEAMMNTRICPIPRGTSLETFRFFEALRYGCILITEALPPRWFYQGAPAIQIQDWDELEPVLLELLHNQQLLQIKHQESLHWWSTKCSEAATGAYIAEQLNLLKHCPT